MLSYPLPIPPPQAWGGRSRGERWWGGRWELRRAVEEAVEGGGHGRAVRGMSGWAEQGACGGERGLSLTCRRRARNQGLRVSLCLRHTESQVRITQKHS